MIRVVICDDEHATETIIRYFVQLNNLPIEIVGVAHNGLDAINVIRSTQPSLVFMDVMMPYLTGFEVIEKVSDIISPKHIVIITGYESFEFAQSALRLGACDIILKPLDFDQLSRAVNHAVGWKVTHSDLVNNVLEHIHNHLSEPITLECLANQFFCSEAHLSREFKKYMDCNIITYLRNVRMQTAVQLLSKNDLSVTEIAAQTGYTSLNGFYQAFRAYTGTTPAAYIKNAKSKE